MEKNSNISKIIIAIVFIVAIIGIVTLGTLKLKNDKQNDDGEILETKQEEVKNMKISDFSEVPSFELSVDGCFEGTLDNELFKYYEIEALEFDMDKHYIGYRLNDFLTVSGIENYKEIEFVSDNGSKVKYENADITDDSYLTFSNSDDKNNISVMHTKNPTNHNLKKVTKMTVYCEETDPMPEVTEPVEQENNGQ